MIKFTSDLNRGPLMTDLEVPTYFLWKVPFKVPVEAISKEIANVKIPESEYIELVNVNFMIFTGTNMLCYSKKYLSQADKITAIVFNSAICEPDGFDVSWIERITTREKFLEAFDEYKEARNQYLLTKNFIERKVGLYLDLL